TLNNTDVNITANVTSSDADGNSIKHIYNWRVNKTAGPGTSITVLNMPFERVNGTNTSNAWDYSGYGNNGSEQGGVVWNGTGGYDSKGAYRFDGTNDYINITHTSSLNLTRGWTLEAWIKDTMTITSDTPIIDKGYVDSSGGYFLYRTPVGSQTVAGGFKSGGTYFVAEATTAVNDGKYHHIVSTYNGTNVTIYVDSSLEDTGPGGANTPGSNVNNVVLGNRQNLEPLTFYNGHIDEIRIFNRSLSTEQIKALFNNRTDQIVFNETTSGQNWTVDVTPNDGNEDGAKVRSNQVIILGGDTIVPAVTWITADQRNYTRRSFNQTFNASILEANINNVYFSFDNSTGTGFNVTGINGSGYWTTFYNVSSLAEGTHQVTVFANDTSGNVNMTESITFITDYTAPNVTFINTQGRNYSLTTYNITFNASIFEKNYVQSVLFSFDNSTGTSFNVTVLNGSGYWANQYNVSSLAEGYHVMTVIANDSVGNINSTTKLNFTVDFTAPFLNFTYPVNGTNLTTSNVQLNFTVSDTNFVQSCWYSLDSGANTTISGCQNTTINSSIGNHYLTLYANDSVNNLNVSVVVNFTINSAIIGNVTDVAATGTTSLNISVNGRPISEAIGIQEVVFKDSTTPLINFSHNFTSSTINLSKITIVKSSTSLIVNLSGQLAAGQTKTLYLTDDNFNSLCVKDAEIASVDAISSNCDGENELNFINCLSVSAGTKLGNITCYDDGAIIRVENLTHSGIKATIGKKVSAPSDSAGSGAGGGGGGGSGRKKAAASSYVSEAWVELYAGETASLLVDDEDLSITDVSFTVSEYVYGAKLELTKKDQLPAFFNRFKGEVYRVLELSSLNLEGKVDTTFSINFIVPLSWISENNLTKRNIKLYSYDGFRWIELPTLFGENDAVHAHFSSDSRTLGFFVIGAADSAFAGKIPLKQPEEMVEGIDYITAPSGQQVPIHKPQRITEALIVLISLLVSILISLGLMIFKKKRTNLNFRKKKVVKTGNVAKAEKIKRNEHHQLWSAIVKIILFLILIAIISAAAVYFNVTWQQLADLFVRVKDFFVNSYNGVYKITYHLAGLALIVDILILLAFKLTRQFKKRMVSKKKR
ncbi:MAG TPA: LamG-like jellyroll fold domain-containing protein, partial [Candidatus Nanoarchaeia archaeon]|nr:LamG-like jellyroll fold domain-containing protein [Candidatus Nanoarchaeia archaeon]